MVNTEYDKILFKIGNGLFVALQKGIHVLIRDPAGIIVTVLIKKDTIAVKRVTHLVGNYTSQSAEICVVVCIHIEERSIRYGDRDSDVVGGRIITCIKHLHGHIDILAVNRLGKTCYAFLSSDSVVLEQDLIVIAAYVSILRVIMPFKVHAGNIDNIVKFFQKTFSGGFAEP